MSLQQSKPAPARRHPKRRGRGAAETDASSNPFVRAVVQLLHLRAGGELSSAWVRERFGVSHPTAKRDLAALRELVPDVIAEVRARGELALRLTVAPV